VAREKLSLVHVYGDDRGNAALLHGHADEVIGCLHGALVVRYENYLGITGDFADKAGEKRHVAVVKRRIGFIEDEKGRGAEHENGQYK